MEAHVSQSALGVEFQPHPPPRDAQEVRQRHEANRQAWNEGAAHYTAGLRRGWPFSRLGGVACIRLSGPIWVTCTPGVGPRFISSARQGVHTLSLWNEGVARVMGMDIADVHIANARRLSAALGAPATWYRCDVLETSSILDERADSVYTGQGALCWLQDLAAWAAVVWRLLKPGGLLHVLDDHPVTWLFEPDADTYVTSGLDYFTHSETSQGWPSTLHWRSWQPPHPACPEVRTVVAGVGGLPGVAPGGSSD